MKTWKVVNGPTEREIRADGADITDGGYLVFSNENNEPTAGFTAGKWDSFELVKDDEESDEWGNSGV